MTTDTEKHAALRQKISAANACMQSASLDLFYGYGYACTDDVTEARRSIVRAQASLAEALAAIDAKPEVEGAPV